MINRINTVAFVMLVSAIMTLALLGSWWWRVGTVALIWWLAAGLCTLALISMDRPSKGSDTEGECSTESDD